MRYRLLHNVDAGFFRPGTPEDRYVVGHSGDTPIRLSGRTFSRPRILEDIFERHNRDDRPDGQLRPSLSVGDVVLLSFHLGSGKSGRVIKETWTVDILGFRQLSEEPTQILEDYPR